MKNKWILSFLVILIGVIGFSFGRVDGAEMESPIDLCEAPYTLFEALMSEEADETKTLTGCELFDEEDGSLRYLQSFQARESEEALVMQIMAWYADVTEEDVQEGIQSLKTEGNFRVHAFRADNGEKLLVQVNANDAGWFDVEISQNVQDGDRVLYDAFLRMNFQTAFFEFGPFQELITNGTSPMRDFVIDFRNDEPMMSSELRFAVGDDFGIYKEYVYSGGFAEDIGNHLKEEAIVSEGGWAWAFYPLKNDVLVKVALIEETSTVLLVEDASMQEILSRVDFMPLETAVEIELDSPLDVLNSDLNIFQDLEMPEGFDLIGFEGLILPYETVEVSGKYVAKMAIEDALPLILETLQNGEEYSVDALLQIHEEEGQIRFLLEQNPFLNGRNGYFVISKTDGGTEVEIFAEDYSHFLSWQNLWEQNFNSSFYSGSVFEDILENNLPFEKKIAFLFQDGRFEVSTEALLNLEADFDMVLLKMASGEFEDHVRAQLKERPMNENGENSWFAYALKNEVNLKFDFFTTNQWVMLSQRLEKNQMIGSVDLVNEATSEKFVIDHPSDLLSIADEVFGGLTIPSGFQETKTEFEVNEYGNVVLIQNFDIRLEQEDLVEGLNEFLLEGFALPAEAVMVSEESPVFLNGLALKGNLIGEVVIEKEDEHFKMSLIVNLPAQGRSVKNGLAVNFNQHLIDFGTLPSVFEQAQMLQEKFVIFHDLESTRFDHERVYDVGDALSDYEAYFLSDEYVKNMTPYLKEEPYQNCEEDCFIEFHLKNGLGLSFLLIKNSGEIFITESFYEDRFFSELNFADSNEKMVVVETPADFFESELNPLVGGLETIPIVVGSTKIMMDEFDTTTLIQFWETELADGDALLDAFVSELGMPLNETIETIRATLNSVGEANLQFAVPQGIEREVLQVFVMKTETGFEGTVLYHDQNHPKSFAMMFEKNFNDGLIPFGEYSTLFDKDAVIEEEMSFYYDVDGRWAFESAKTVLLGDDFSVYADYFSSTQFASEVEKMGATQFETWNSEGELVYQYFLFGVEVRIRLNEELQKIKFDEKVIEPTQAIENYTTPILTLEGMGFNCSETEDVRMQCGTDLMDVPVYMMIKWEDESGMASEIEVSNGEDLILGKYDFIHIVYDLNNGMTFYEIGRDVEGSFKLVAFWMNADGELIPADEGKELKIFKEEFEYMAGEEMTSGLAAVTSLVEGAVLQEWGMELDALWQLPIR